MLAPGLQYTHTKYRFKALNMFAFTCLHLCTAIMYNPTIHHKRISLVPPEVYSSCCLREFFLGTVACSLEVKNYAWISVKLCSCV